MYLKSICINNWKSINKVEIDLRELMIFIGKSNSGKSSIFSAILYYLGERNYRATDKKDDTLDVVIEGVFKVEDTSRINKLRGYLSIDEEITLRIVVEGNKERYYIRKKREFVEIGYKEYEKIVGEVEVIFIPPINSQELTKFFYKKILGILEREGMLEDVNLEKIIDTYSCLKESYASKGLQRNAIFSILRLLARYSKEQKQSVLKNALILYEEPELYLHPQAERELFSVLKTLSRLGTGVYICTHSSIFIDLDHYYSICVVRRDELGSHVFQVDKGILLGDEVKKFNMNYWINPDRGELFFATKVILVEGQTDKIVIPYLGKKLGVYKYDYSIIECGSKSTLPQYIKLLNSFQVPYVVVYDKDEHSYRDRLERQISRRRNREIDRLVDKRIGVSIPFENDIEEEIVVPLKKGYKNKPFTALKTVDTKGYRVPNRLKKKILAIYR